MPPPTLSAVPYKNTVYRNIFTCSPSQHLLDDVAPEKDWGFVDQLIQAASGIDHSRPQHHRPFQYAQIYDDLVLAVFRRENWSNGRFSDGSSFGVWYGAEDEMTSIFEACWTTFRFGSDNVLPKNETYTVDRRLFRAQATTERACDLVDSKKDLPQLVHPYDYSFCQELGAAMAKEKYHLLRTPSARRIDGVCIPVFEPEAIDEVAHDYFFKIHVNPDRSINVNGGRPYLNFTTSVEELEDPYGILKAS